MLRCPSIETEDSASHLWHVYTELAYEASQKAKEQNDGTQPPSCPNNRHQEDALFVGGTCPLDSQPPRGLLHDSGHREANGIGKPSSDEEQVIIVQYGAPFSLAHLPPEAKSPNGLQLYWDQVGARDQEKDSSP